MRFCLLKAKPKAKKAKQIFAKSPGPKAQTSQKKQSKFLQKAQAQRPKQAKKAKQIFAKSPGPKAQNSEAHFSQRPLA